MRTPQQASNDSREAREAWEDGRQIQVKMAGQSPEWLDFKNGPNVCPRFTDPSYEFRVKPTPKLRPWKPEEVPLDAWFKGKNGIAFRIAYADLGESAIGKTVASANGSHFTLDHVFKEWTHSTDGGKTWHPCGEMEGGE